MQGIYTDKVKASKSFVPFEIPATFNIQVKTAVESYYKEASLVVSPKH